MSDIHHYIQHEKVTVEHNLQSLQLSLYVKTRKTARNDISQNAVVRAISSVWMIKPCLKCTKSFEGDFLNLAAEKGHADESDVMQRELCSGESSSNACDSTNDRVPDGPGAHGVERNNFQSAY
mgnify:CR=1 FL=1